MPKTIDELRAQLSAIRATRVEWRTLEEARMHLDEIKLIQQQVRLLKTDVRLHMRDIRTKYTDKRARVAPGLLAMMAHRRRSSTSTQRLILNRNERAELEPFEALTRELDSVVQWLSGLKLQINRWMVANKR